MSDQPGTVTQTVERVKNLLFRATNTHRKADFAEAHALANQALSEVKMLPDGPLRANLTNTAYRRIVETLERRNQFDIARSVMDEWQEVLKTAEATADCMALRARIAYRQGDYDSALRYIDEGMAAAQSGSYVSGMASLLRFRADVFWMRGDPEQALPIALRALSFFERIDDLDGRARALNTIAITYSTTGRFYKSITYYLRAITIMESLGDQAGLRVLYSNVGEAYQQIYAMKTALFYHEQALKMSGDHPSPDLIRNMGVDLVAVGRVDEGLDYLLQALELARAQNDVDAKLQVLHSLADAVLGLKQVEEAKTLATELLGVAEPLESNRHVVRAKLILGHCAKAEQDLDKASQYLQDAFILAQKVNDKGLVWQAHAALADLLAETRPDMAKVHGSIAQEMVNSVLASIEDAQLQDLFRTAPQVRWVLEAKWLTGKG